VEIHSGVEGLLWQVTVISVVLDCLVKLRPHCFVTVMSLSVCVSHYASHISPLWKKNYTANRNALKEDFFPVWKSRDVILMITIPIYKVKLKTAVPCHCLYFFYIFILPAIRWLLRSQDYLISRNHTHIHMNTRTQIQQNPMFLFFCAGSILIVQETLTAMSWGMLSEHLGITCKYIKCFVL
jgi:hypothetical protein